jgi:hypothetical protein
MQGRDAAQAGLPEATQLRKAVDGASSAGDSMLRAYCE